MQMEWWSDGFVCDRSLGMNSNCLRYQFQRWRSKAQKGVCCLPFGCEVAATFRISRKCPATAGTCTATSGSCNAIRSVRRFPPHFVVQSVVQFVATLPRTAFLHEEPPCYSI